MRKREDELALRRQTKLIGKKMTAILEHVRKHNAKVPMSAATELTVGTVTYHIDGGEPVWMKADSTTEFFITLESQHVQLGFKELRPGTDEFAVTKRLLPGSIHREKGSQGINLQRPYNYS